MVQNGSGNQGGIIYTLFEAANDLAPQIIKYFVKYPIKPPPKKMESLQKNNIYLIVTTVCSTLPFPPQDQHYSKDNLPLPVLDNISNREGKNPSRD